MNLEIKLKLNFNVYFPVLILKIEISYCKNVKNVVIIVK